MTKDEGRKTKNEELTLGRTEGDGGRRLGISLELPLRMCLNRKAEPWAGRLLRSACGTEDEDKRGGKVGVNG